MALCTVSLRIADPIGLPKGNVTVYFQRAGNPDANVQVGDWFPAISQVGVSFPNLVLDLEAGQNYNYNCGTGTGGVLVIPAAATYAPLNAIFAMGVSGNPPQAPAAVPRINGSLLSSTALTLSSPTVPTAGRGFQFTATRNGGTAWTNTANSTTYPLAVTGLNGIFVVNQTTTNGNTCVCTIYGGDAAGTANVTDTVNGTTAQIVLGNVTPYHIPTGALTVYVGGGLPNCGAPLASIHGTAGSTQYWYQFTAVNANGETAGSPIAYNYAINNVPTANTYSAYLGNRIVSVNNGPATLNGTNYISLSLGIGILGAPGVPAPISYNIWRSTDAATWTKIDNVPPGSPYISYNDQGATVGGESLPANNTTFTGNDANNGLTPATAVATYYQAQQLAAANPNIGTINVNGWTSEVINVQCTNGVNTVFADPYSSGIFSTFNGENACISPGSHCDFSNGGLALDTLGQTMFGNGTSSNDPVTVDCTAFKCVGIGMTNMMRFAIAGFSVTLIDCQGFSYHGTTGCNAAGVMNVVRGSYKTNGYGFTSSGGYTSSTSLQVAGGGILFARETEIGAVADNASNVAAYAIGSTGPNSFMVLTNVKLYGGTFDLYTVSNALLGTYLRNTQYNTYKNFNLTELGNVTTYSQGTNLPDPVIY